MKKNDVKVNRCKGKNCGKILPQGYEHRYCEACRTSHAERVKNGLKAAGGVTMSALGVAVMIASAGRIKPRR